MGRALKRRPLYEVEDKEKEDSRINELEKNLINLVKARPALFDPRVPEEDRSKQAKQKLWQEVSEGLDGKLHFTAAEFRWRYLRESYIRAKNKEKLLKETELNTESPAPKTSRKIKKHSFRYYDLMDFLDDTISLPKNVEKVTFQDLKKLQRLPNIIKRVVPIAPKPSSTQVNTAELQPNIVTAANSLDNTVGPFTFVHIPSQNSVEIDNFSNSKDDPKVIDYDKIFLECLQKPIEEPSPVDGFLIRLGEGLKKLPYRERSKLELEFLQRLYEVEEQLENNL